MDLEQAILLVGMASTLFCTGQSWLLQSGGLGAARRLLPIFAGPALLAALATLGLVLFRPDTLPGWMPLTELVLTVVAAALSWRLDRASWVRTLSWTAASALYLRILTLV